MDALEKVSTKGKAVNRMIELTAQYADGGPVRLSVVHAGVTQEAEALQSWVEEQMECLELHVTMLSPTISVHMGPGTLGLAVCPDEVGGSPH